MRFDDQTPQQNNSFGSKPSRLNGRLPQRSQPDSSTSFKQTNDDRFKREIIKDILSQVDYQAALNRGVVDVEQKEIFEDLERLPTRTLVAWYEAFLYIRSELMYAGYELNGLKILDRPADAIRKLMESDPDFDLRQYIF